MCGKRHVGDGGVEHLHERGQRDRQGDQPRVIFWLPGGVYCVRHSRSSCSACLQAGICSKPGYWPEGGRYVNRVAVCACQGQKEPNAEAEACATLAKLLGRLTFRGGVGRGPAGRA